MSEQLGSVWLDDDLSLKIGPGAVAEILVILPRETVSAPVNATAITVNGEAPTAFPIGGERPSNYLFSRSLLKYLKLRRRRLTDEFGEY